MTELFTASDLARFCGCDLKTVHNWVDKGQIEYFRTPGRHLRFTAAATKAFLERFGYPVPEQVRDAGGITSDAATATLIRAVTAAIVAEGGEELRLRVAARLRAAMGDEPVLEEPST